MNRLRMSHQKRDRSRKSLLRKTPNCISSPSPFVFLSIFAVDPLKTTMAHRMRILIVTKYELFKKNISLFFFLSFYAQSSRSLKPRGFERRSLARRNPTWRISKRNSIFSKCALFIPSSSLFAILVPSDTTRSVVFVNRKKFVVGRNPFCDLSVCWRSPRLCVDLPEDHIKHQLHHLYGYI